MARAVTRNIAGMLLVAALAGCTSQGTGTDDSLSAMPTLPASSPSPRPVTVDNALTTIGAKCRSELSTSADCHWDGVSFLVEHPKSWRWGSQVRSHICKQEVVNDGPGLKMLTDGRSWWVAAKTQTGLLRVAQMLSDAGLVFKLAVYCP